MKMFLIIYSREADEAVMEAFKQAEIPGYTKMEEVRGMGTVTEPKLGTHIWPGMNNILFLVLEESKAPQVKDLIKKLREVHPRAGIRGLLLPLEECI